MLELCTKCKAKREKSLLPRAGVSDSFVLPSFIKPVLVPSYLWGLPVDGKVYGSCIHSGFTWRGAQISAPLEGPLKNLGLSLWCFATSLWQTASNSKLELVEGQNCLQPLHLHVVPLVAQAHEERAGNFKKIQTLAFAPTVWCLFTISSLRPLTKRRLPYRHC